VRTLDGTKRCSFLFLVFRAMHYKSSSEKEKVKW